MYGLFRRLLFCLEPERAHALALGLMRLAGALAPARALLRLLYRVPGAAPVQALGLTFPNALGLAAGYDKDGLAWRGLACLGFGHLEIGTVTPRPQPGNPRPRLFRLPGDRALVNRLGFPSQGAERVAARLRARRPGPPVVGVNLGKQKDTPLQEAAADYEGLMDRLAPVADYLAINISSPNTENLRRLQARSLLQALLAQLAQRRAALVKELGRPLPLVVKLAPDLSDEELDDALQAICDAGTDGIIATNTTVARPGLRSLAAGETGGLSGLPLLARSTEMVRKIHQRTAGQLPIIAAGGVAGPDHARAKLDAGAVLVQLYTGLVYEGPGLVRRILRALGSVPDVMRTAPG